LSPDHCALPSHAATSSVDSHRSRRPGIWAPRSTVCRFDQRRSTARKIRKRADRDSELARRGSAPSGEHQWSIFDASCGLRGGDCATCVGSYARDFEGRLLFELRSFATLRRLSLRGRTRSSGVISISRPSSARERQVPNGHPTSQPQRPSNPVKSIEVICPDPRPCSDELHAESFHKPCERRA
jgi:hypothetical protein